MLDLDRPHAPDCAMGEQHCGERRHREVPAGPQRSRIAKRQRAQRPEAVRRVGLARLTRRAGRGQGEPHAGERHHRKWWPDR
jgi:hypothetical protein